MPRYLTRAGWTPDISNLVQLCLCPDAKKHHFKFYARSQLGGGISTIVRPAENSLTRDDKLFIDDSIRSNLKYLPIPTLFKMDQMEFWKNDNSVRYETFTILSVKVIVWKCKCIKYIPKTAQIFIVSGIHER